LADRLRANLEQWLLPAPDANPAMLEMLRDRDRLPRRDLREWAGEFAGKYLTAAVLCNRVWPDARLTARLERFVAEFIACQDAEGYLGAYPRHERYTGRTWDGKRALWDIWNHYHAMLGLMLWHDDTGDADALAACRRMADGLCARFLVGRSAAAGPRLLDAGAEEMNLSIAHGLGLLYQRTGEERYLALLRQVEAEWRVPPAGDYVEQALAGVPFYQMPKPRWESLHAVQAILTLYEITGDERYRQAFGHIWRSIAAGDRHNTGGFSSGEQATGNPFDPRAIETCCTVAWMALTVDMLRLTGDATVADELELSFFNGALGAQAPSGRWWTYNTPMDGVRKASAHEIVFQSREGSPELNCCSVNGPRALGMLSQWAVMRRGHGLAINYYGPGVLAVDVAGQPLRLIQTTDYPRDGRVAIQVELERPLELTLALRVPRWSIETEVRVNSQPVQNARPGAYLELARTWQTGDTIELAFDMRLHVWRGQRECQGRVSLYRGPLLLAYDRRYNACDPAAEYRGDDDVPAVAPHAREVPLVPYSGPGPAPWLLAPIETATGVPLVLCDMASAGAAGTPYRTWLPADEGWLAQWDGPEVWG
jgi:hypothetical protein